MLYPNGITKLATAVRVVPPLRPLAPAEKESAAAEKQHHDDDDQQSVQVHFSLLVFA